MLAAGAVVAVTLVGVTASSGADPVPASATPLVSSLVVNRWGLDASYWYGSLAHVGPVDLLQVGGSIACRFDDSFKVTMTVTQGPTMVSGVADEGPCTGVSSPRSFLVDMRADQLSAGSPTTATCSVAVQGVPVAGSSGGDCSGVPTLLWVGSRLAGPPPVPVTSTFTAPCSNHVQPTVSVTATSLLLSRDGVEWGEVTLTAATGATVSYQVRFATVAEGHEEAGTEVVANDVLGSNWLFVQGDAFFSAGGYLASVTGTSVDICHVLGVY